MNKAIRNTFIEIKDFYIRIVSKPAYYLPVLFFSIVGFGFSIFNRTISIDDLARDLYFGVGNQKIAGHRWGQYLIIRLFSNIKYTPFLEKFVGLVFVTLGAFVFSTILYYLNKKRDDIFSYALFSCTFITFPMINEIWEYNESCIPIGAAYLIISFCILYQIVNERISVYDYLFLGCLMSIVAAGIESVFVAYITFVLIVLYIRKTTDNGYKWIQKGIFFSIPLILSVVLRILVGTLLIKIAGIKYAYNGSSGIYWTTFGISESLRRLYEGFWLYLYKAKYYLPLTEFFGSVIVFNIINVYYFLKTKRFAPLLIGFCVIGSLFSISLLQGDVLPLRVAHIFSIFVAFVVYWLITVLGQYKLKKIKISATVLLFFVVYRQSVCLHTLLTLNNQRYNNEVAVVYNIGNRLYSEFDVHKPVVFCGHYDLGKNIRRQIKEKTETNVQSLINWSMIAFGNQNMMKELFSYCGYDINVLDEPFKEKDIYELTEFAVDNHMLPMEIRDFGEYIMVFFGDF